MITRNKLFFTEIWSTTFLFQDIYNESTNKFKEYVDSLSDAELMEFIEANLKSWYKGFESGILANWDTVAKTIANNTNLPSKS